jgi:hypothetical protein
MSTDERYEPEVYTDFEKVLARKEPKWIDFGIDWRFWALTPAFNLNFHDGFTFEFEWLCFGIYITKP